MAKKLLVLLAASVWCNACHAGSNLYLMTDERGGVTLSDIPQDARYRMLDLASIGASRSGDRTPAALLNAAKPRRRFEAEVAQAAKRFGVDAALVHAVILVESAYNPNAVSRRGASGLMQLMEGTAKRYGVADVFDPAQNVRGGTEHLGELLALFGNDVPLALAAYNAGAEAVRKHGNKIPPFPETLQYVPKVFRAYRQLHE